MPRKGYTSVTLDDEVIAQIDSLVDVSQVDLRTRPKVVERAVNRLKEVSRYD